LLKDIRLGISKNQKYPSIEMKTRFEELKRRRTEIYDDPIKDLEKVQKLKEVLKLLTLN
jgi:hypothetical protein